MDIQSEKLTIFTSSDIMQYPSSTISPQIRVDYDIALVGAGISSAHTLLHYIELLERQSLARPVRLVVTEKSGEFWTGIPYGVKSGYDSLTISSLREFIPQQLERDRFVSWLNENRDWVFAPQKYRDGELTRKWLAANSKAMSQGMWDELFIPRHVYGMYLKHRLAKAIEKATKSGTIEIDLLTTEAIDVLASEDRYRVKLAAPVAGISGFSATTLVLAIGSPPNVAFDRDRVGEDDICYVENMYEPSMDFNIDRIWRSLQQSDRPTHRQVLMVGSNAGTLDALYCLNNSKVASAIDKFIVLSPNAAFPHRISREIAAIDYAPLHLETLIATTSFTAQQILAAVERDVAAATARQINISDIYTQISGAVIQALNLLDRAEQQQFVSKYAVEIGKLQRRAGAEYLDVVDSLVERGKLTFIKGRFSRYIADSGGEYIDSETRLPTTIDAPIRVVINCAGFQDVTRSSSQLIQNLIGRGICTPNESKRGFKIDRNFEASKNCYLMGPLVAGNIDGDFKVWHAESCQRIIDLSKHLAEVLLARSTPQFSPVVIASVVQESPVAIPQVETVGTLVSA